MYIHPGRFVPHTPTRCYFEPPEPGTSRAPPWPGSAVRLPAFSLAGSGRALATSTWPSLAVPVQSTGYIRLQPMYLSFRDTLCDGGFSATLLSIAYSVETRGIPSSTRLSCYYAYICNIYHVLLAQRYIPPVLLVHTNPVIYCPNRARWLGPARLHPPIHQPITPRLHPH